MRRRRPAGNRAVRLLAIVLAALLTMTMPVAALGAEEGQEVPAAETVAEPQPQATEPAAGEKQKEETASGENGTGETDEPQQGTGTPAAGDASGSGETAAPGETGGENGRSGQEEGPGAGTPASGDASGSGETAAPGETGSEAGTGSGDGQADGGELPGANVPGEGENADGGETPGADTPGEQGTDEGGQTSETVRKTLTLHIVGTDGTVGEEIGTARGNVGSTLSLTALLETERRVEQAGEAAENSEAVETAETGGDGAAAQEAAWSVTTEAAPCEVVWTSSDTSIATVTEDGIVKGVTGGTVTITATAADDVSLVAELTLTSYAGRWKKVNKKWKFVLPNGKYAKNRFVTVDGKK